MGTSCSIKTAMPLTVVKPVTAETFKPYAKLCKSNSKIQNRICGLLFRICMTDDPAVVNRIARH